MDLKKLLGLVGCSAVVLIFLVFAAIWIGFHRGEEGKQIASNIDCSGVTKLSADQYNWVSDAAGRWLNGDEAALISLVQIESGWRADAKNSSSSALGLGQFLTSTAAGFPEFVGGNDKAGTFWPNPPGQTKSNPLGSPDARLDPKRSIYATAHLLGGMIKKYGSLGEAYEYGYHTHGNGDPATVAAAQKARKNLETVYNKLINGGGCQAIVSSGGSGCNGVPVFRQCDSNWGNQSYGAKGTICTSGCGVSAAAMVLKFYGKNVDPNILASFSASHGGRGDNGTNHSIFPKIAQQYNLKNENGISWDHALDLLKQGKPVIASGEGPPPFTSNGHFIVLTCYNSDGTIGVNDSADSHPGVKNYPASIIKQNQHFLTAIYP